MPRGAARQAARRQRHRPARRRPPNPVWPGGRGGSAGRGSWQCRTASRTRLGWSAEEEELRATATLRFPAATSQAALAEGAFTGRASSAAAAGIEGPARGRFCAAPLIGSTVANGVGAQERTRRGNAATIGAREIPPLLLASLFCLTMLPRRMDGFSPSCPFFRPDSPPRPVSRPAAVRRRRSGREYDRGSLSAPRWAERTRRRRGWTPTISRSPASSSSSSR